MGPPTGILATDPLLYESHQVECRHGWVERRGILIFSVPPVVTLQRTQIGLQMLAILGLQQKQSVD